MKNRGGMPAGTPEIAISVLETHGYEAMETYIAAVKNGADPPAEYLAQVRPSFVYLAFFVDSGAARYLKVGMADDVAFRMKSHRGSCPLPVAHLYVAALRSRAEAAAVEARLLRHMDSRDGRLHGEWARVDGPMPDLLGSLGREASETCGRDIVFTESV